MDPIIIAVFMLFATIALICLGSNIGVALLVTSIGGLWWITGDLGVSAALMGTGPFYVTFDYALAVIPLFVLMGLLANASGASKELYQSGFAWFGRLPGGLGIVTVVANAVFAAVTGVSIASAAVFSKIAVPQMMKYGYSKKFSTGCVAGSSALGMLIPPSIMLIIYGLLANQSIGDLFMAGVMPGVLLTVAYSIAIIIMALTMPKVLGNPKKPEKLTLGQRFKSLWQASSVLSLVVLVLGGMYAGIFTPTEAGAVGCVGALIIMIVKRRLTLGALHSTLMEAGFTTASVFLLFIGAQLFGRMLTISGLVGEMGQFITSLTMPPLLIIASMLLILMLMGTFLDVISILVIAMPILLPAVEQMGFNLIWFGILCTISIETGLITPPFGMSVFVIKGSLGDLINIEDIFIGSFPFLLVLLATIVILLFVPQIATWLPSLM